MFNKLKHLLLIQLQENGEYKGDMLIYTFAPFVLPLVLMTVWLAVANSSNVLGSEKSYIVSYFYYQIVVNRIIGTWHASFLGSKIRNGDISKDLLKPFPPILYDIANNVGEKIWKIAFSIPALMLIGFTLRENLLLPTENSLLFIITLIGAATISFLIAHIIGLSAFWLSDVGAIASYNEILNYITSGKLFPLEYVSKFIPIGIINILPYKYTLGFPLDVLLGKTTGANLFAGLLTQFVWVAVLYLLYRVIWHRGLQKYGGYGG